MSVFTFYSTGKAKKEVFLCHPKWGVHLADLPKEHNVFNKITVCRQDTSPVSRLHPELSYFHSSN